MEEKTGQIIERAKEGDEDAFEELVVLYRERVFRLAFRVVRDKDSALDVAQDVFIRIHRELPGCRGVDGFEGWLYRLATNLAIDHYRRAKRRRMLPVLGDVAGGSDPERSLQADRAKERLGRAMDCLTERQRKVFVLRHYEDLNTAKIARAMKMAEGTVKATLHQAINKMRVFLEKEEDN